MSIAYTINIGGVDFVTDFAIDDTDPNYTYMGYANPGTAKNANGWNILRISKGDGGNSNLNTGRWADGSPWNLSTDNKHTWDNRATYTYAS